MVAARMFLPAEHCALIVDQGTDFPAHYVAELKRFGEDMTWLRPREGKTTRALNIYSGSRIGFVREAHPDDTADGPEKAINRFSTSRRS